MGEPHDVRGHLPYHEYEHPTDHVHAPVDSEPAGLREALEDAAAWLEAEAAHPRPDPRPAMRLQASVLRAAALAPKVSEP